MTRRTFSNEDWMDRELKARQVNGASQHIREALIARWRAEDDGTWQTPELDREGIELTHEAQAVADGGG